MALDGSIKCSADQAPARNRGRRAAAADVLNESGGTRRRHLRASERVDQPAESPVDRRASDRANRPGEEVGDIFRHLLGHLVPLPSA